LDDGNNAHTIQYDDFITRNLEGKMNPLDGTFWQQFAYIGTLIGFGYFLWEMFNLPLKKSKIRNWIQYVKTVEIPRQKKERDRIVKEMKQKIFGKLHNHIENEKMDKIAHKTSKKSKQRTEGRFRTTSIIIAIAVAGLMVTSSLGIISPSAVRGTSIATPLSNSEPYPNSDFLWVWQRPNGTDPLPAYQYPGAYEMTPRETMLYYGTQNLQVVIPTAGSRYEYTWVEIGNLDIFPSDCRLLIGLSSVVQAQDIADHAVSDSRIVGGWVDDYPVGQNNATVLQTYWNALQSAGRPLELWFFVYGVSGVTANNYFKQTPNAWGPLLPYFTGCIISTLDYQYSMSYYRLTGWEDALRDFKTNYIPGKKLMAHLYNHGYNFGSYPLDFNQRMLLASAKLYREGIVDGISLLETFWNQHNPIMSNLLRNGINSEVRPDYETVLNASSMTATTTIDGMATDSAIANIATKWAGNYTFESLHTQQFIVTDHPGTHLTVQNLRTGDIEEAPGDVFVAEAGETYQVYDWPHTHVSYAGNVAVTSPTTWTDKEVLINGTLYINDTFSVSRSVVRFGHDSYNDTTYNHISPKSGLIMKATGDANLTFIADNSTFEPLLRNYPFSLGLQISLSYPGTLYRFRNTTFAVFTPYFMPGGYIVMSDCIVFGESWCAAPGTEITSHLYYLGYTSGSRITGSLFYNYDNYYTQGVRMWVPGVFDQDHYLWDDNVIVGARNGLRIIPDGSTGILNLTGTQIYPSDYRVTNDYWGPNSGPIPWDFDSQQVGGPYQYVNFTGASTPASTLVSTTFYLKSDIAITGTLTDANATMIGTYSTTAGEVYIPYIQTVTGTGDMPTWVHPFPWTFTITSELPDGYYYAMRSVGGYGPNTTMRYDPWFLPATDKTFIIQPEESNHLEFLQIPKEVYIGMPTYVTESGVVHMGTYINAWSLYKYEHPEQVGVAVDSTETVWVNMSVWSPTSEGLVAQWSANGTSASATFTLSSLESGLNIYYDIYVDGNLIDRILCTSGSITFSYSGSWSEHQFIVTKTKIANNPNFSGLIILLIIIASISVGLLFFGYKEEYTITRLLYLLIGIFVGGILLSLAVITFWI
jgi:hypothetical protein